MISIVTTAKPVGAAASACRHRFIMTIRASQAARDAGGCTNPTTATQPPQSRRSIHLEQGFGANRLNTGTMTNLTTLGDTLLANFLTLHIPGSKRGHQPSGDFWAMVRARRAESLAAYARRDQLRRALVQHGYRCFLDRMECDPAGGWRLHFFVADVAALTLLDELTEGACGPGDPVSFNPEGFLAERLRHLIEIDNHS